jgi:hypothetical protein
MVGGKNKKQCEEEQRQVLSGMFLSFGIGSS